jgi:hypothetical protein
MQKPINYPSRNNKKNPMSNKHASKQHCLVGNIRPKSKLRKRKNKAKARARREARQAEKTTT